MFITILIIIITFKDSKYQHKCYIKYSLVGVKYGSSKINKKEEKDKFLVHRGRDKSARCLRKFTRLIAFGICRIFDKALCGAKTKNTNVNNKTMTTTLDQTIDQIRNRKSRHTSATTVRAKRNQNDAYFTPKHLVEALLQYVPIGGTVLEICNGDGAFTDVLARNGLQVFTNDIDPDRNAQYCVDASDKDKVIKELPTTSWIITNPPFNMALPIIENSFDKATDGIAFLLRSSFTETTFARQEWLKEHEDYLSHILFLPRVSFTGDKKTDSMSCNFYVYQKKPTAATRCIWVTK